MRNREEHLQWCKDRALEYVKRGDLVNAVASMGSDLEQRPDTKCDPFILMLGGMRATDFDIAGVRRWIEGFR